MKVISSSSLSQQGGVKRDRILAGAIRLMQAFSSPLLLCAFAFKCWGEGWTGLGMASSRDWYEEDDEDRKAGSYYAIVGSRFWNRVSRRHAFCPSHTLLCLQYPDSFAVILP